MKRQPTQQKSQQDNAMEQEASTSCESSAEKRKTTTAIQQAVRDARTRGHRVTAKKPVAEPHSVTRATATTPTPIIATPELSTGSLTAQSTPTSPYQDNDFSKEKDNLRIDDNSPAVKGADNDIILL